MDTPLFQDPSAGQGPQGKQARAAGMIMNVVADYLSLESNRTSLITVTNIFLTRDMGKATIYVTVLPETATKGALDFINRKRDDVRTRLKQKLKLRRIPFVVFEEDFGEKNRRHIDELLRDNKPTTEE